MVPGRETTKVVVSRYRYLGLVRAYEALRAAGRMTGSLGLGMTISHYDTGERPFRYGQKPKLH